MIHRQYNLQKLSVFIIAIFAFSIFGINLQAQEDLDAEVAKSFDDSGLSHKRSLIKIDPLSMIAGDFHVSFEQFVGRKYVIEVGLGVLLFHGPEFTSLVSESLSLNNPGIGYSYFIYPKFNFENYGPESFTIGFQYRKRVYNQDPNPVHISDFTLQSSFQWYAGKRSMFALDAGVGFRVRQEDLVKTKPLGLAAPIAFKFAYLL